MSRNYLFRIVRRESKMLLFALFLFLCGTMYAQEMRTVTGRVVDNVGSPVIGAAVMVQGTSTGTVTDVDGRYSLQVPPDATLVVSFIGYDTETQVVTDQSEVNFTLFDELNELEELMVIGYGTQKRSDLTGAISQVKGQDLVLNPSVNPMEALQGKVAGLDITKESGQAGSGVNMQLRGNRSFTASGTPTFIIDGMPGDYSTLNPNDIENIEILKDASSTAVYGASGANGVVLITTKHGKEGKMLVNLNVFAGFNGWSRVPEVRSGESYIQVLRDAAKAAGNWSSTADDKTMMDNTLGEGAYDAHLRGEYIDWTDELLKTSTVQSYSLSVSGGNERTKSYLSLNFSDENGQYSNDNNKVYSTKMKIDYKVRDWFSIGINNALSFVYRNSAYTDLGFALRMMPLGKLYDEDGNLNPFVNNHADTYPNLLLNSKSNYRNNRQNLRVAINPYIEITPFKGFSWLSRVQANINVNKHNYFQGEGSYQYYYLGGRDVQGTNVNCYAEVTTDREYDYKWENVLTYNTQIADVHDITVTAVSSWNHDQNDSQYNKETNITDNAYLWHNMGKSLDENSKVLTSYSMSKGLGFVGRVNYGYAGKYLASVSVRRDGSSRLSEDYRWDTFPAFSLGWRISEENFMQNTRDVVDNLKIRFGYGVTGTANIKPYQTLSTLDETKISFSGQTETVKRFSQNYANSQLGWEKSYNTNIGLDANLFDNRIDFAIDLYKTKTKDVIWTSSLPIVNGGFDSSTSYKMARNIAQTENRGVEVQLTTTNIKTDEWLWKSNVSFAANHEEVTKLIDGASEHEQNGDYWLTVGEPVKSFYDNKIEGVWQKGEEADAAVFARQPGDIKLATNDLVHVSEGVYEGIDSQTGEKVVYTADNVYAADKDKHTIGHNSPDWTLGFKNEVNWRNWDLSVFMFWRWGQTIKYELLGYYDPSGVRNFPTYFNYWTEDNPSNEYPAIYQGRSITAYPGYSSLQYVDGSYFKIKNITLGYTLPNRIMDRIGLDHLRFYATITNPLIHAKSDRLKDYDPEQNGNINYPLTKQFVFGMNLTF